MTSVKKIKLILENCESVDITNAVGDFSIDNISNGVRRIASNCIAKILIAKEVFIQLYKHGEFDYHGFNKNDPITRLKTYRDITSIEVTYDDSSVESYYVDYNEGEHEGALGAENINQKTYETENSLFILISESKTFDNLDIEEVDSEWYLDQDVTARIDLKNNGHEVLFNSDSLCEVYINDIFIRLTPNTISICKFGKYTNTFPTKVFLELLSYLFYTFEIKSNYDISEFKYLKLVSNTSTEDKQSYRLELDSSLISIQSSDDEDMGYVLIDGLCKISIKDMLSLMWILSKMTN